MKKLDIFIPILHTINIIVCTTFVILDMMKLWYWMGLVIFSVMIWIDHLSWRRGFNADRKIQAQVLSTFHRVMEREKNGEIRISNQDDFNKHFVEESKLDKYYKVDIAAIKTGNKMHNKIEKEIRK